MCCAITSMCCAITLIACAEGASAVLSSRTPGVNHRLGRPEGHSESELQLDGALTLDKLEESSSQSAARRPRCRRIRVVWWACRDATICSMRRRRRARKATPRHVLLNMERPAADSQLSRVTRSPLADKAPIPRGQLAPKG